MKKLLIVTDAWFPQVNGVVTALEKMRVHAEEAGYTVVMVHPAQFLTVPFLFYSDQPLAVFTRRKLQRIILNEQPDYIHIATEWTLGLTARSICMRWSIPFTTSYHTNMPAYVHRYLPLVGPFAASLAVRYMRWFHNVATSTLVSSPTMRKMLEEDGFTQIAPWQLGVDTELFSPARASESAPIEYQRPIFMYVGRIAKEKNIEEFLEARLPGTKLIVGDGPEMNRLKETYVGQAHFLGCKRGVELARTVAQSDVFVFPSRSETFGLVMLEAMASGVPVAAHYTAGPQDVISHGVDGCLDDDLARAAIACLSISEPVSACRAKAELFAWEHSGNLFLEAVKQSSIRTWPVTSPNKNRVFVAEGSSLGRQALRYVMALVFAVRSTIFSVKSKEF